MPVALRSVVCCTLTALRVTLMNPPVVPNRGAQSRGPWSAEPRCWSFAAAVALLLRSPIVWADLNNMVGRLCGKRKVNAKVPSGLGLAAA